MSESTNDNMLDVVKQETIDKAEIRAQIFEVRGFRVMLDCDIAAYFGVTTGNLNKAMKRNVARFPESFCFQLNEEEKQNLIFQIGISSFGSNYGGRRKLPYVYTEQGVAMLTSTLHTERAIAASIQIIEAFVEMSHYLKQNSQFVPYDKLQSLELKQYQLSERVDQIEKNMVAKSDISEFMKLFDEGIRSDDILIMEGRPFTADLAFQSIYSKAKKNIIVIDNYLSLKTLNHLACAKPGVEIIIISDNKGYKPLKKAEYNDFHSQFPDRKIKFIKARNRTHDRHIIIDFGTKSEKMFLCGTSSKDAGKKITMILQFNNTALYTVFIEELLANPSLELK